MHSTLLDLDTSACLVDTLNNELIKLSTCKRSCKYVKGEKSQYYRVAEDCSADLLSVDIQLHPPFRWLNFAAVAVDPTFYVVAAALAADRANKTVTVADPEFSVEWGLFGARRSSAGMHSKYNYVISRFGCTFFKEWIIIYRYVLLLLT